MRSTRPDRHYTPAEFSALIDQAKANAVRARQEAQVAFWNGVSKRLRGAWRRFMSGPGAAFGRPIDPSWPRATR